ncbi:ribonuclease HII [Limibaculum sp. M0105]|uniref:Ribonuclease HII n=2 Tax=Thermohalobaculum xanthum TaxID=2753746 RepID=A0A8J7MB65_9RHOB|nr:ribonuclease HII [Thermohalobaculum xanthum]MBK0401017.1 ribonuclease HII [Thermohalobaculum xanthum]
MLDFSAERAGALPCAGVDEAGRGPWAGPVVAAAVVLDPGRLPQGLGDSKKLTAARRVSLFEVLGACAEIGVGRAEVDEIDSLGILRANDLAMRRALAALPLAPARVLIDGNRVPPQLGFPAEAIVRGDGAVASIAAASIIAKVTRDRIMAEHAIEFPQYGWERNAGYGTAAHRAALAQHGVTPLHRRSFAPIHKMLCEGST